MPRRICRSSKISYRPDAKTAVCYADGRRITLGPWPDYPAPPSPDIVAAFNRIQAERAGILAPAHDPAAVTVAVMANGVFQWADVYFKDSPKEIHAINVALGKLVSLFGDMPANSLGSRHFDGVQNAFVAENRTRQGVNKVMGCLRRMLKRAVRLELLPVAVWQASLAVGGLCRGRTVAPESVRRMAVSDADVAKTLPFLPAPVAAMVSLQRFTGARPGEICRISMAEIERQSDQIWIYRPASHKCSWRGHERRILLGPRAIEVLTPWLRVDGKPLFQPRFACRHVEGARKSRKLGEYYPTSSYCHAIAKACLKAGIPRWSPNQLRKTRATEIRESFGLEASAALCGHSAEVNARHYSSPSYKLAVEAALATG